MPKKINWSKVISGVVRLITGPSSKRRLFIENLLRKSNKSANPTQGMIYYYILMYRQFCALRKACGHRAKLLFTLPVRNRILEIDRKVSESAS